VTENTCRQVQEASRWPQCLEAVIVAKGSVTKYQGRLRIIVSTVHFVFLLFDYCAHFFFVLFNKLGHLIKIF